MTQTATINIRGRAVELGPLTLAKAAALAALVPLRDKLSTSPETALFSLSAGELRDLAAAIATLTDTTAEAVLTWPLHEIPAALGDLGEAGVPAWAEYIAGQLAPAVLALGDRFTKLQADHAAPAVAAPAQG
jgi:hypothetical protein